MKRIVETHGASEAGQLLRQAGPLPRDGSRRVRVWQRIAGAPRSSGLKRALGSLLIPGAVLASSGAIAASSGGWPFTSQEATRAPTGAAPQQPVLVVPAKGMEVAPAAPTDTAPTEILEPAAESSPVGAPRSVAPRSVAPRSVAPQPLHKEQSDESALLLEALKARRAGDKARAAVLASDYQKKHPGGALHEEALALQLEAALARKDGSAARLARRYLERYPKGRFLSQAHQALAASP